VAGSKPPSYGILKANLFFEKLQFLSLFHPLNNPMLPQILDLDAGHVGRIFYRRFDPYRRASCSLKLLIPALF